MLILLFLLKLRIVVASATKEIPIATNEVVVLCEVILFLLCSYRGMHKPNAKLSGLSEVSGSERSEAPLER
jgi:hypothetical protein